jgi:hypothetical protein
VPPHFHGSEKGVHVHVKDPPTELLYGDHSLVGAYHVPSP